MNQYPAVSRCSRGLTPRDSRAYLQERDPVAVSSDRISRATDAVSDGVKQWQGWPRGRCERRFSLRMRIRDQSTVRDKAV